MVPSRFTIDDAPCCVFGPAHGDSMEALIKAMASSNGWAPPRALSPSKALTRAIGYLNSHVAPSGTRFDLSDQGFWLRITSEGWLLKFASHPHYSFIRVVFVSNTSRLAVDHPSGFFIGYEFDSNLLFFDEYQRKSVQQYFIATESDIEIGFGLESFVTHVHEEKLREWLARRSG